MIEMSTGPHGHRIIAEASVTALREMAEAILNRLADYGDNAARHSARILLNGTPRQERIDDAAALAKVGKLAGQGRAREAVAIVAREIAASPEDVPAVERRLRRKRRKNETDIEGVSAAVVR